MDADFVVVGGGIGGTVLAELLGRGGKRVLLLERSATPPNWVRPEILWPAAAEVLFSLIPRVSLEREALLPLQGIEVHVGQRAVASVSPEFFDEIHVQRWSADPNRTRERLLGLGAFELRRGVEVIAALKEKDRIVGVRTRDVASARERDILTPCTVGDDGSESVVRRACGLEMETRLFPLGFLCFEFRWPASLTPATPRVWLNPNASAPSIRCRSAMRSWRMSGISQALSS